MDQIAANNIHLFVTKILQSTFLQRRAPGLWQYLSCINFKMFYLLNHDIDIFDKS